MSLKPNARVPGDLAFEAQSLPRDLGEGLVLRYAVPDDGERLAQFNGRIFGRDHFDAFAAAWTRDFVSETHPTCGASNVVLVEDTRAANKTVSTMCLIPQTWSYAGVPFGVGRVEAVGTDPDYRRRGLVRTQIEVLHAKSAAMGHWVQAITGIFWFYRQFDYEYALELGGGKMIHLAAIPGLKDGESEPYRLRPMTHADIPFAQALYNRQARRLTVVCPRPDWLWRHLLSGYSPDSFEHRHYRIVQTGDGRAVGYVGQMREIEHKALLITELAVVEGQSLRAAMPSVLRALKLAAQAESAAQNKEIETLYFSLGREHPLYQAIPDWFTKSGRAYAWYIRVADVPGLLRHIGPALEARLAQSALAGYSGELKVGEFVRGVRIVFEQGRIALVEPWIHKGGTDAHATFPPSVFLQLLFGLRSIGELRTFYPDCWAEDEADVLLDILFPRTCSHVIPVG